MNTFYHRAPWLDRLTGIGWIWITGPVQLWLPGVPQFIVIDAAGNPL